MSTITIAENEMRSFFERVASQFVSLSSQAQELQVVKRDFQEINTRLSAFGDRVTSLEEANAKLKTELNDVYEMAHKLEADLAVAKRDVAERDNTIADLTKQLATQSEAYNRVTTEREDVRSRNLELAAQVRELSDTRVRLEREGSDWQSKASNYLSDRDYWAGRSEKSERDAIDAQTQLKEAMEALKSIRSAVAFLNEPVVVHGIGGGSSSAQEQKPATIVTEPAQDRPWDRANSPF